MTIEFKVQALLSLFAVMLFATFFPGVVQESLAAAKPVLSPIERRPEDSPEKIANQVLSLVNAERQKAGAKLLSTMPELTQIAQRRSQDMAKRGYFDHCDPQTGALLFVEMYAKKDLVGGGENLFMTEGQVAQISQSAVGWWMGSSSHQRNMLNPSYRWSGVGVFIRGSRVYITQVFLPDQDTM
jgi:uncharacterized protein YkwD